MFKPIEKIQVKTALGRKELPVFFRKNPPKKQNQKPGLLLFLKQPASGRKNTDKRSIWLKPNCFFYHLNLGKTVLSKSIN